MGNTLKWSMLDRNSWQYAFGGGGSGNLGGDAGYGQITIEADGSKHNKDMGTIIGVLKEPVNFGLASNWISKDQLAIPWLKDTIAAVGKVTEGYGELLGVGEIGSIWKSKKYWSSSDYLSISGTYVVIDWNGTGDPLKAVRNMARYMTVGDVNADAVTAIKPITTAISDNGMKLIDKGVEVYKSLIKEPKESKPLPHPPALEPNTSMPAISNDNAALDILSTAIGAMADTAKVVGKEVLEDFSDITTLGKSPTPVRIVMGQYFDRSDMVLEKADFKFSKEVSEMGPLSVEITFSATSRKKLGGVDDAGNGEMIGFKEGTGRSRVTVI